MAYIFIAALLLLGAVYIIYRILDLLARRKFAQSYATWEPDLGQYYRRHSPYVRVESSSTDREEQERDERLAKAMEDLLRMQGRI